MVACIHNAVHAVQEGKNYLAAMSCAANYAWVNRSSMTFLVRQAFQKMFKQQADDLDMHVVYDVSHNIAKVRPRAWAALAATYPCGLPSSPVLTMSGCNDQHTTTIVAALPKAGLVMIGVPQAL